MVGKGTGSYVKQRTNKENMWERRNTGQFWKGTRIPLGDPQHCTLRILRPVHELGSRSICTRQPHKIPNGCTHGKDFKMKLKYILDLTMKWQVLRS